MAPGSEAQTDFATKADQAGNDDSFKACFGNPMKPHSCLFLGLGIFFLCNPALDGHKIFAGTNQASRFSDILVKFLKRDDITAILEEYGLTPEDLGTHSLRKSAGTYGASAPFVTILTLCLRACWKFTTTMQRYIFHEKGGDLMLGRVLALLPMT